VRGVPPARNLLIIISVSLHSHHNACIGPAMVTAQAGQLQDLSGARAGGYRYRAYRRPTSVSSSGRSRVTTPTGGPARRRSCAWRCATSWAVASRRARRRAQTAWQRRRRTPVRCSTAPAAPSSWPRCRRRSVLEETRSAFKSTQLRDLPQARAHAGASSGCLTARGAPYVRLKAEDPAATLDAGAGRRSVDGAWFTLWSGAVFWRSEAPAHDHLIGGTRLPCRIAPEERVFLRGNEVESRQLT
jgi:hypothetical protein